MASKIGILGAGNWGTVLGILAARNGHSALIYDRNHDRVRDFNGNRENKQYLPGHKLSPLIEFTNDMSMLAKECELLIPVVPAANFRSICKQIAPFVKGYHFIVHGTKGIEPGSFQRMSQILQHETGALRIGVVSGPNLAEEIASEKPGATVVASSFDEVNTEFKRIFHHPLFHVYESHDLPGVEWIGSLKNLLAILSGVCDQLNVGQNATAHLLTRALNEINDVLMGLGARAQTMIGLAGFGDIFATATSQLSRNFQAGRMLAQGKSKLQIQQSLKSAVEGFTTLDAILPLSEKHKIPTLKALHNIAKQVESNANDSAFEIKNIFFSYRGCIIHS